MICKGHLDDTVGYINTTQHWVVLYQVNCLDVARVSNESMELGVVV